MNDMLTRKDVLPLVGDLEGKILVLNSKVLRAPFRFRKFQLWKATGGFGCSPTAHGASVFATCLADGEKSRWNRGDFIGIYNPDIK